MTTNKTYHIGREKPSEMRKKRSGATLSKKNKGGEKRKKKAENRVIVSFKVENSITKAGGRISRPSSEPEKPGKRETVGGGGGKGTSKTEAI